MTPLVMMKFLRECGILGAIYPNFRFTRLTPTIMVRMLSFRLHQRVCEKHHVPSTPQLNLTPQSPFQHGQRLETTESKESIQPTATQ